jgi:hypothetical protein
MTLPGYDVAGAIFPIPSGSLGRLAGIEGSSHNRLCRKALHTASYLQDRGIAGSLASDSCRFGLLHNSDAVVLLTWLWACGVARKLEID